MQTAENFPIVGIGASAGGVEALEGFFKGVPAKSGLAYVVVTHLSPARESLLHEIIARYTDMSVSVAADGDEVQVDTVNVLPANAILGIDGGRLRIHRPDPGRRERKPIDIFLSALAADRREYSAGVILSGGDGDGTLGIKAIKERGGITFAQVADGHGPSHPDMPNSAISTGFVDFAIPVDQMGGRLVEFARGFEVLDQLAVKADPDNGDQAIRHASQEIYAILRNQSGHDFSGYKTKTFLRRVQRRMLVTQSADIETYIELLREQPIEIKALFRDLLINVTNFFRDAEAFAALGEKVIPKLFDGRGATDSVRIWIPGCATGEEVYSIAILMREHMETLSAVPRVQIFATDIDEHALSVARGARYPEALLDSVSDSRKKRFFTFDGGSYVVSKDVRDICVFSPHSVIKDPPFSKLDMVSCRNLLIYFGADVQNQVIPIFHYSLRPGGFLFLGTAENISQFSELFTPIEKKQRIFRRGENTGSTIKLPLSLSGLRQAHISPAMPRRSPTGNGGVRQLVEGQILDRFAPPHVVANSEGDVVFYSSRTGKYLEAPAGAPSRQLLVMARKSLRLDLRSAFRDAIDKDRQVVREGVPLEDDRGEVQTVTITIEPLPRSRGEAPLYLVVFTDTGITLSRDEVLDRSSLNAEGSSLRLEAELRQTRERLQSLVEEYETALEELKSSNEELVSLNEELQSTNEELEASKEELQSLNEELHTVNGELSGKVEALDSASSDLQNLFESTQVATVFLDRQLVIRSFTPAVSSIFSVLPGDKGRPLTDLSSKLDFPTLAEDVHQVFSTGQLCERSVRHAEKNAHFLARLLPYTNVDQRIEGVVVTFVDVTGLTQAEAHHRVLIAELNHRVKNMLAVVTAIAEQTYKSSPEPGKFKQAFLARIHAMARSYELLSRENWTEASVRELVLQEVAPFGDGRVLLHVPNVHLKPRPALSLGMVIHELVTNAAKYGALSVPAGHVDIAWAQSDEGRHMRLDWREQNGPPVEAPTHRGLGLKLVEREVGYSLHGSAKIRFEPDGLNVSLRFDNAGDEGAQ
ncbi:CheR family methyltransferase [Rhizobium leguminosarum]|uniref:CheR family methyltransferase n=1 Tax=Rhizobium leguminosarum TaxID=384 RepID=UPI003F96CF0F